MPTPPLLGLNSVYSSDLVVTRSNTKNESHSSIQMPFRPSYFVSILPNKSQASLDPRTILSSYTKPQPLIVNHDNIIWQPLDLPMSNIFEPLNSNQLSISTDSSSPIDQHPNMTVQCSEHISMPPTFAHMSSSTPNNRIPQSSPPSMNTNPHLANTHHMITRLKKWDQQISAASLSL